MITILLVEDESAYREPLAFSLRKDGFTVIEAETGTDALAEWDSSIDLVLLDLMLPGLSGIEVARAIRARSQTPIIMLTAKDSESDKVEGLDVGADDYVTKPYSYRELLARIRAVLRRKGADEGEVEEVLNVGPIMMDISRHEVTRNGNPVALPLREFELLEYLMTNANRVVTRGQIIDRVWGANYYGDTKTLDVHIKRLRSKLESDPAHPELITTVRGLGYKIEPPKGDR